eukprot:jgi/Botrbrau1/2409/Bobra.0395s0038.1
MDYKYLPSMLRKFNQICRRASSITSRTISDDCKTFLQCSRITSEMAVTNAFFHLRFQLPLPSSSDAIESENCSLGLYWNTWGCRLGRIQLLHISATSNEKTILQNTQTMRISSIGQEHTSAIHGGTMSPKTVRSCGRDSLQMPRHPQGRVIPAGLQGFRGRPCLPMGWPSRRRHAQLSHAGTMCCGVDPNTKQVRVQAGGASARCCGRASAHGLTLQNYASIREQSIGGFIQVSAHGTGAGIPPVDEQVVALKLVTPGRERWR